MIKALMYIMTALLSFPDAPTATPLTIRRVSKIRVESSFKDLTSRAEIILPRNVRLFGDKPVRDLFRRGHRVQVQFGYDGNNVTEFEGYISQVSADIPIVIKCEDEMWKLKQMAVNYSKKSVTLQTLLTDICPGYEVDALEGVSLGSVRFAKATVAKVLEKLQSEFSLYSYMRGKTLVCGKYYAANTGVEPLQFILERNVADNGLQYRIADDILVKVKGTSIKTHGDKIEYEHGEEGGDQLNLTYFNISTQKELEVLVKHDYERRKVNGYTGTFSAYGVPTAKHGIKAELKSYLYPDRNGTYYIDSVNKTFEFGGIRQTITLGSQAV